jgi:glycosyltransferase involved in cell wall biosynthesis
MTKFSLILACYNEGPTFEANVWKIEKELKKIEKPWEIIFVEDKSQDGTRAIVEKLTSRIKGAKAIYHSKNKGRGRTVSDGIRKAKGRVCGYMDVDCEISPSYIPRFIKEIENGLDLVCGKRFYENGKNSFIRVITSKFYSRLVSLFIPLPITDTEAGFKFFNKEKILNVLKCTQDTGWFWDTEICARAYKSGLKLSEIPVLFKRRSDKKSTVKLFKDSYIYLRRLIKFSFKYRSL